MSNTNRFDFFKKIFLRFAHLRCFVKKFSPCGELYFMANRSDYLLGLTILGAGFLMGRRIARMVFILSGVKSVGRQRTRGCMFSAVGAILAL